MELLRFQSPLCEGRIPSEEKLDTMCKLITDCLRLAVTGQHHVTYALKRQQRTKLLATALA